MKLLIVARSTSGHAGSGGMEKAYESALSGLSRMGHLVGLVTTTGGSPTPDIDEYWPLDTGRNGRYSRAWWRATGEADAPWMDWAPNVILSISRAARAMTSLGIPIVAQCHGTALAEIHSSLRTRTPRELAKIPLNLTRVVHERDFYRRATLTIAVGDAVAAQLAHRPIRLSADHLSTIPNGIDTACWAADVTTRARRRKELGLPLTSTVGITTSRLHRQKGVDLAIGALSALPDDNLLVVCGDGPEEGNLRRLARHKGVEQRVRFAGNLETSQLAETMAAADHLVFPTRREEGLPLSLLEALASGLTAITTRQAQPPPGTEPFVVVTRPDADSIARAWASLPPRQYVSVLPDRFRSDAALGSYERVLRTYARSR